MALPQTRTLCFTGRFYTPERLSDNSGRIPGKLGTGEKSRRYRDYTPPQCFDTGKNTLYAPKVQSQVKDGRSIDDQLLLHTGLLPLQNGTYSIKYPHTFYPSLAKAMKRHEATRAVCMIADNKTVWNGHVIEPALGFDTLLHRDNYILDEKIGNKRRLSDGSFLRQCEEKLKLPEICPDSVRLFIQCVTVTGHSPFYLPEKMKRISFSENIPQRMNDYMTVANYTDHAI